MIRNKNISALCHDLNLFRHASWQASPQDRIARLQAVVDRIGNWLEQGRIAVSDICIETRTVGYELLTSGDARLMSLALRHGANLEEMNDGYTPFLLLCAQGKLDAACVLAANGANLHRKNGEYADMWDLLLGRLHDPESSPDEHALEDMKRLSATCRRKNGPGPEIPGQEARLCYITASAANSFPVQYALAAGCDPNGKDRHGQPMVLTPLKELVRAWQFLGTITKGIDGKKDDIEQILRDFLHAQPKDTERLYNALFPYLNQRVTHELTRYDAQDDLHRWVVNWCRQTSILDALHEGGADFAACRKWLAAREPDMDWEPFRRVLDELLASHAAKHLRFAENYQDEALFIDGNPSLVLREIEAGGKLSDFLAPERWLGREKERFELMLSLPQDWVDLPATLRTRAVSPFAACTAERILTSTRNRNLRQPS